jgi:hypothetical protein
MSRLAPTPRLIAFYLPQFHPIRENDEWWGTGFTEWTNVAKATPRFPGHYQPHVPADLGFYDLRLPEARQAQADLARTYGIHGFCYYHYWFNGRRLLGRPLDEVLTTGQPNFPFCLCWANENWTRRWDGQEQDVLIEQKYGDEDDREHIRWLVDVFRDARYIRIAGKPLFLVYRARLLPDPARTFARWREEARRRGIGEIYLCRVESFADERDDPREIGFDAAIEFQPDWCNYPLARWRGGHAVYDYAAIVDQMLEKPSPPYPRFPCVTPSWDNSPRRKSGATIFHGSTPAVYERWLRTVARNSRRDADEDLIFINAWNEWGEGNHLEPCQKWGRAYLEATRRAIDRLGSAEVRLSEAAPGDTANGARDHHALRVIQAEAGAILRHARAEVATAAAHLDEITAELVERRTFHQAREELAALIPVDSTFILVDDQAWGNDVLARRHHVPFLERDGQYWGAPSDDATAICELERLRRNGSAFVVFASAAFWWLEYYGGLREYLRTNFRCVAETDRIVVYDVRERMMARPT